MDFPKEARIRFRREYLEFFKGSTVHRLGSCLVFRIPNQKNHARLGITVKSRTNSVHRNKIKRTVRECFRLNRSKIGSFDYNIVIPSQVKINFKTSSLVRAALDSIWANENIF